MYQRFLKQDYTEKQGELLKHLAMLFRTETRPKKVMQSQKKLFAQLSPRDQYLLQHEGQAYIAALSR